MSDSLFSGKPAFLTARIFVQDKTARDLAWLARVEATKAGQEPSPQAVDALADTILRAWLDTQPLLGERQEAVRKALAEADNNVLNRLRERA